VRMKKASRAGHRGVITFAVCHCAKRRVLGVLDEVFEGDDVAACPAAVSPDGCSAHVVSKVEAALQPRVGLGNVVVLEPPHQAEHHILGGNVRTRLLQG
jgi:hypothetical protein